MAKLSPAEQEWKECFDIFDQRGVGSIKRSDLGQALRSLGAVMTQSEVADLESEVSGDLISWEKFKEFAARKPKRPEQSAAALKEAFKVFDMSGTGRMDIQELEHIVTSLGEKISAQEFQDIRVAVGLPAAGPLDYQRVVDQVAGL
eukprot:TRINITY_DN16068_c0_g2_i1.p1 TRINITY_DN16068_c0_g2~~TRINITY_DN16068_c0_g2_i1.p1  ORF type:complete len:146 (+),score=49.21 TRINITY_DN16068_c0_g2_i1:96-533(+)